MTQSRQLAAIMFTDIVGYTAMMQANEQKAVAVIKHYNQLARGFTKTTEAYEDYLKGRYHWNMRTDDGIKRQSGILKMQLKRMPIMRQRILDWQTLILLSLIMT